MKGRGYALHADRSDLAALTLLKKPGRVGRRIAVWFPSWHDALFLLEARKRSCDPRVLFSGLVRWPQPQRDMPCLQRLMSEGQQRPSQLLQVPLVAHIRTDGCTALRRACLLPLELWV